MFRVYKLYSSQSFRSDSFVLASNNNLRKDISPGLTQQWLWVSPLLARGTLFRADNKWLVSLGTSSGLVQDARRHVIILQSVLIDRRKDDVQNLSLLQAPNAFLLARHYS